MVISRIDKKSIVLLKKIYGYVISQAKGLPQPK